LGMEALELMNTTVIKQSALQPAAGPLSLSAIERMACGSVWHCGMRD